MFFLIWKVYIHNISDQIIITLIGKNMDKSWIFQKQLDRSAPKKLNKSWSKLTTGKLQGKRGIRPVWKSDKSMEVCIPDQKMAHTLKKKLGPPKN